MKIYRNDYRARIFAKKGGAAAILGPNNTANIMQPLYATKAGVLFPYTPTVQSAATANYDDFSFTHSNYKQYAFQNSNPGEITVSGQFTAQTEDEAKYLLATLFFFRTVTKSYFGEKVAFGPTAKAGLPPPVLHFSYLGDQLYNKVPVVVSTVNTEFLPDVDYVPVIRAKNDITYVPARMTITLTLLVQQNPNILRKQFDLDAFKQGKMIGRGFI